MKLIICLSIALTSLMFQGVASANGNDELDNLEFKYLVCGYLEDSETMEEAISNIDAATEDLEMSDHQEDVLEEIEDEELTSETYCVDLEY